MIDLQKAFSALPPPVADPQDAEAARRVWLRARIAAIVGDEHRSVRVMRLRIASAAITIAAFDAIVPLLLASAAAPPVALLGALVITHVAASLALVRA
jgi:hypothetical protein